MATKTAQPAKFKSDAFEAIHTSASALLKIGAISKTTMRSFDESCLAQLAEIKLQSVKLVGTATSKKKLCTQQTNSKT